MSGKRLNGHLLIGGVYYELGEMTRQLEAVPDMLRALKAAEASLEDAAEREAKAPPVAPGIRCTTEAMRLECVRAAIAKATGEAK